MARTEIRYWQAAGRPARRYRAFVPDAIAALEQPLSLTVQERCEAAAQLIATSERATRSALATLAEREILTTSRLAANGPGRPVQVWMSRDILRLLD
jgi:predicted ArsR family transcriptional regulator